MPFHSSGPHFCPDCPPQVRRKDKVHVGVRLELVESNYSGCGVDIASCPECGKTFQISYKVDEITEVQF